MKQIAVCFTIATGVALCQSPAFEVASVKPAAPVTGHFQYHMTMRIDGARVDIVNASLTDLIHSAYRVNSYQVEGPSWMTTQKFDLEAKLPEGGSKDQVPEMLQALLAERFQLAVHRTRRDLPAYALVPRKGGAKLKDSPQDAGAGTWSRTFGPEGTMHMETKNMTAAALAQLVASFLDYPVVDMTDLHGSYDIPLDFSPEDLRTGAKLAGVGVAEDPGLPSSGSAIGTSLQQVGLKLESRKLPIDLIVVDHLEKNPTAN
ncbi:MAG TPA: TIGR03435 family protein [Bryobacteraceae bacterium]|nr:TIGR03435 family protein [Bryobacteraceae bacterium]